jgi:hypothetical protein
MKLNNKRTFLVGLAFFSISAFWQLYDAVVPLMLRDTFHLGDTISGFKTPKQQKGLFMK